jgi:hypothetical protein
MFHTPSRAICSGRFCFTKNLNGGDHSKKHETRRNIMTITNTLENQLMDAHGAMFAAMQDNEWDQMEARWHDLIAVIELHETQQEAGYLNHLHHYLVSIVSDVINDHEEGCVGCLESMLNGLLVFSRLNDYTFEGYPDVFWLRALSVAIDAKLSMETLDAIVSVWFATTDNDFRVA